MKETHITIYIHDLEISDKSKSFLARVGLMKLDDILRLLSASITAAQSKMNRTGLLNMVRCTRMQMDVP